MDCRVERYLAEPTRRPSAEGGGEREEERMMSIAEQMREILMEQEETAAVLAVLERSLFGATPEVKETEAPEDFEEAITLAGRNAKEIRCRITNINRRFNG